MQINTQNHSFDLYDDCCFLFEERLYHTDTNNHVYLICVRFLNAVNETSPTGGTTHQDWAILTMINALPSLPRSCNQAIK